MNHKKLKDFVPRDKIKKAMGLFVDTGEQRFYYRSLILIAIAFFLMFFVFGVAFLASLRGAETTFVPNVIGKALPDALIDLQEKELYPRLQVRFSSTGASKGEILSQNPSPGVMVRAGRRVTIVMNRGGVIDKIEDYVGQSLDDVRSYLGTLSSGVLGTATIHIKDPIVFVYSNEPIGTILEQTPPPGTEISEPTGVDLVVSRGSEATSLLLQNYVGLPYKEALSKLIQSNIPAIVQYDPNPLAENAGKIVSQTPKTGTRITLNDTITLFMGKPHATDKEHLVGLFQHDLPRYPVFVSMRLEEETLSGERKLLWALDFPGGYLSLPYEIEKGSSIVLLINEQIIIKEDFDTLSKKG